MRENPIRDFRERQLGWSRAKLAQRIGRSEQLIALYEAEAPDEILRKLAIIAAEEGHANYEEIFLRLAGDAAAERQALSYPDKHVPRTSEEDELVRYLLEIVRDPDPDSSVQAGVPQLIRQIYGHRVEFYKRRSQSEK